ncbi:MAG: STAS domain-containing protein [Ruminococcaceae bacterium]|nr:STAS domain-containing protein [Oscillospiraceae bacterium]MBQ8898957.1 STAS domain-containing protein [Clostridia bacterium]
MIVDFSIGSRGALVTLSGELDHHCASGTLREIQRFLDAELPGALTVDMKGVAFMDSSGIALINTLRRRQGSIGGSFEITNIQRQPMRVLGGAGLTHLAAPLRPVK